jgi:ketosteroid isomerase-like protein
LTANADMIRAFYTAFQARDHAAMAGCYHPDIHFSDPVFEDLHGDQAKAMWHMLLNQGTDLAVSFEEVTADGEHGSAHWEARYTFIATRRPVHNRINAAFTFADGLIIRHVDRFDLWRWTRMALGTSGTLVGWTPTIKKKVRRVAGRGLDRFMAEHPEYRRPG